MTAISIGGRALADAERPALRRLVPSSERQNIPLWVEKASGEGVPASLLVSWDEATHVGACHQLSS